MVPLNVEVTKGRQATVIFSTSRDIDIKCYIDFVIFALSSKGNLNHQAFNSLGTQDRYFYIFDVQINTKKSEY